MKLIVCIDDNGGMSFNHRRQTKDVKQRLHLNGILKGCNLWLTSYSEKLYKDALTDVKREVKEHIIEDILRENPVPSNAGENTVTFVKEDSTSVYTLLEREWDDRIIDRVDEVLVYKWNRSYPEDVSFPIEVLKEFVPVRAENFEGSSHDVISFEVYKR